jgi:hypothetical protein
MEPNDTMKKGNENKKERGNEIAATAAAAAIASNVPETIVPLARRC